MSYLGSMKPQAGAGAGRRAAPSSALARPRGATTPGTRRRTPHSLQDLARATHAPATGHGEADQ